MDKSTIVGSAVGILTLYLSEGGKELTKIAAKDTWEWVKGKLTSKGEVKKLSSLELNPDSKDAQKAIKESLLKIVDTDKNALRELSTLVSDYQNDNINIIGSTNTLVKNTFNIKNNFFSARRSIGRNEGDYGRNISIIMIN